ncbi:MAG: threonylcarbamoyl-AMP synthase [Muribaculaceae bacterium]|nr:threonylcarbamoyl-AMP synthase [Muribaculaceae bacterium]
METIKIWNNKASERQLRELARRLDNGEIAIVPTDSLYAIVGDALNSKVIDRICRLKGINPDKTNLSIICSDISTAAEYARIENNGYKMLKEYTPGPFTWLFRSVSTLPKAFKGRKTVGVRIPDNEFARELAQTLGRPLITTSIEFEDDDYAINPGLIAENYEGKVDFMVEGEEGITEASTIVDLTDGTPVVTRDGLGKLED